MAPTRTPNWKIAGIYFLIYIGAATLLGMMYSLLVIFFLGSIFNQLQPMVVSLMGAGVSIAITVLATKMAAGFANKRYHYVNKKDIASYAFAYGLLIASLFLLRDTMIVQVDGVTIERNHFLSIASSLVNLAVMYISSLVFLRSKKGD